MISALMVASNAQGGTTSAGRRTRDALNAVRRAPGSGGWVFPAACNVPGYAYGNSVWATLMATNSACWGLRQIQENNEANRQDAERRRQDLARIEAERVAALRQMNREINDANAAARRAAAREAASVVVVPAEPVASGESNVVSSGFVMSLCDGLPERVCVSPRYRMLGCHWDERFQSCS